MYSSKIDTKVKTKSKVKGANAVKGSDFIITINTNKSFHCCDGASADRMPALEKVFGGLIQNLFNEHNLPKLILEVKKNPDGTITKGKPEAGKIISVKSKAGLEANLEGRGFLHAHAYIHIEHKTKVQLNIQLIKTVSYKILEPVLTIGGKFQRPYINIRGVNSSSVSLERYI